MKTLGFIGMGNMAGAIAAGIIQKGLMKKDEVFAYAPHYDKLVKNAEKIGFTACKELKELVAHAASPKADPENVTIAFADSLDPFMAGDKNVKAPIKAEHGNPWWLAIALLAFGLFFGHKALTQKINAAKAAQEEELNRLREMNEAQEKQIKDLSVNAADLIQKQSQLQQGLL